MSSFQSRWRSISPAFGTILFILGFPYICFLVSFDKNSLLFSEDYLPTEDSSKIHQKAIKSGIDVPQDLIGIPATSIDALKSNNVNGYLLGNSTHLKFVPYHSKAHLRIIVLTMDRPESLHKCLQSLNSVRYGSSIVSLHIWIDRWPNGSFNYQVYQVAKQFNFTQGSHSVHLHPQHVGIQQQWITTWRPFTGTSESAIVLEDDMVVSPYFWHWLQQAHGAYDKHNNIAGYGLSHPGIAHKHGNRLEIPDNYTIYMYRILTTWGFSPHHLSWRNFQNWFYRVEQMASFQPLVPGILPTEWYISESKAGKERNLWEMWHIYYTHKHNMYTVLLNSLDEGLLAVNRHEKGLHDGANGVGAREKLCSHWKKEYDYFPPRPPRFGYDGLEVV